MFELYQNLLDKLRLGVIIYEYTDISDIKSLTFRYFNPEADIMRSPIDDTDKLSDHLGERVFDIYPEFFKTDLCAKFYDAILTQESKKFESIEYRSRYVPDVVFSVDLIPLSKTYLAFIYKNITNEIELQNNLIRSQQRYERLIEDSPYGIVGQEGGVILFVNKEYVNIFGYNSKEEILGRKITEVFDPAVREQILKRALNREKGGDEPTFYETIGLRKDGTTFPMSINIAIVEFDDGPITIAFIRDLSEIKKLEENLLMRQKMDSIGILASGIVHDFNNILTVITMNLSSIDNDDLDLTKIAIQNSLAAVNQAADLLKQIRTLSSDRSFRYTKVDLHTVIKDVFEIIQPLSGPEIEINIQTSETDTTMIADYSHLYQIFLNLGTNSIHAIKLMKGLEKPRINVKISKIKYENFEESKDAFQIIFEDNGIGISPSIKSKIFDPLFTTKKNKGDGNTVGHGLGLTIVFNIVKNYYKGEIAVTSNPGDITRFEIILPIIEPNLKVNEELQMSKDSLRGKETILIIDDNLSILKLVKLHFEKLGYTILVAENGEIGLEILENMESEVDLIILDLIMPKLSGKGFLEKFENQSKIPILISTGYSDEFNVGDDFEIISKPFSMDELLIKVRTLLS